MLGKGISFDHWRVDEFWYLNGYELWSNDSFRSMEGPWISEGWSMLNQAALPRSHPGSKVLLATWSWCVLLGPQKCWWKGSIVYKEMILKNIELDQNSRHINSQYGNKPVGFGGKCVIGPNLCSFQIGWQPQVQPVCLKILQSPQVGWVFGKLMGGKVWLFYLLFNDAYFIQC